MPTNSVAAQLQMLRCHLAEGAFAFDATRIRAIHRWESVDSTSAPEPGSIGQLEGKPVYPLAELLGLDHDTKQTAGPVLLLDNYAIQVDKISRPTPVPQSELRRLPNPAAGAHHRVAGLARIEGELTLVLDPARLMAEAPPAPPNWPTDEPWRNVSTGATDKLLCFLPPGQSQDTYLAIGYRQAVEVAQGLRLSQLRSGDPWLAGLVDWRARAVPVVDIAGLLGIGSSARIDVSRTLIARAPKSGELFAFPATHLAPLPLPLSEDSMVRRTIDPPSPYVRAAYELSEGYLFLPDLDRLAAAAAMA